MKTNQIVLLLAAALCFSCVDKGTQSDNPEPSSSSSESSSSAQTSSSGAGSSSSLFSSSSGNASPATLFATRTPKSSDLQCRMSNTVSFTQKDWICSFDYQELHGYFYLQATPEECIEIMSPTAVFSIDKAELYLGGTLHGISSAAYNWGGNHQNDHITFKYNDMVFKYYHSSFGFGWRQCQPMDCMQVYASDSTTLIADGCTAERTLPAVCRMADSTGTFAEFTDTFAKCYGDDS